MAEGEAIDNAAGFDITVPSIEPLRSGFNRRKVSLSDASLMLPFAVDCTPKPRGPPQRKSSDDDVNAGDDCGSGDLRDREALTARSPANDE